MNSFMNADPDVCINNTPDATKTAADVVSGKTFYAGDKTIKTGALKGYATDPSLSYNAGRHESATSGQYNTPFHSSGARYFVQCTGASVVKISKDKVRGGWACYGYSDFIQKQVGRLTSLLAKECK